MTTEFYKIFDRDIARLAADIDSFNEESNLWIKKGSAPNTAGNLCLHLIGNLKTFVGNNMGGFAYTRDRDAEFNSSNIPKDQLVAQVKETREIVLKTLEKMTQADLDKTHPQNVLGYEMSNNFFLIHLASHLSYHLGQINYLRRIIE